MKKILFLFMGLFLGLLTIAQNRADFYWSGSSPVSDNIDQGSNWYGGVNPSPGDNLYFNNTSGLRHWAYSNYGVGSYFGFIITYNGAGGIKLYGDNTYAYKFENNSDGDVLELSPSSASVGERQIGNRIDHDLEINPVGSGGILVSCDRISIDNTNGARTLKVYGDNVLTINGYLYEINGTGSKLHIYNSAYVTIKGNSNISGTTTLDAGTLELQGSLASSAVTVKSGATLQINGDDITVASLTVESGGNVEIVAGKSLTVSGNIVNNQTAGIVLKSPESSGPSGSLIVEGTVSGSGTITAERYIAAASWSSGNDGFHLISSPVAAEEISGEWTPSSDGNDYDFYGWSEEDQTWVNQKNTTEDPTWAAFHPSANFNVGQGYLVAYQTAATKSFSGTLNIGDKEVTLTQSGTPAANNSYGYNLIGNPFTSALDWTHESWGTENSNYSGVAKIWSGGAFIDVVTTNPVDNDVTVIPAMNGFFVYTSTHNNTFTIPAAAQVHSADNWHKSVNNNQAIKLSVKGVSSTLSQGSSVRFNPEATSGFDLAFDSYFMAGYAPMFYSVSEGKNYSTNTLPAYDSETTIPFVFVKNEYTDFELELTNSIEGQHIFLTDNKTGAIHKFSENPVYSFTASEGDNPNRFLLHFGMVGVGEQEQASTLQAYVVDNRLYVNNSLEQAQLAVYDLQGRLVAEQSLNSGGLQSLPLDLPAGVYIVRLNNASESRAVKINVQ